MSTLIAPQTDLPVYRAERRAAWHEARLIATAAEMARLGHDLRGILSPALLTSERLQGHPDGAVRRAGDVMIRTVDRVVERVHAALENRRDQTSRETYQLGETVTQAAARIGGCPAVRRNFDSEMALFGRGERLTTAIAELLHNAARAGAGEITVRARQIAQIVEILVTDNGPGVTDPDTLFQPGPGFGLAIARELLRAEGGTLDGGNAADGRPSFRITLPAQR